MRLVCTASSAAAALLLLLAPAAQAFQTAPVRVATTTTKKGHHSQYHRSFVPAPVFSSTKDKVTETTPTPSSSYFEQTASATNKIGSKPIPYEELTIGVLKETYPGENRVSQSPDSVASLVKAGLNVIVQSGGA